MFAQLKEMWDRQDARTKMLAFGVIVVLAASVALSWYKATSSEGEDDVDAAEGGLVAVLSSEDASEAAALTERLIAGDGQWEAVEDDLCVLVFEQTDGTFAFQEFDGDLRKGASVSFSAIEVTENGWQGRWRVVYESDAAGEYNNKATEVDAYFQFSEDPKTGICTIRSEAFPTYEDYQR